MTNLEICNAFVNCKGNGKHNLSMHISTDGSRLYSYNTCIAQKRANGSIIINATRYSVTTSKHQSHLRGEIPATLQTHTTTKHVPFNTWDLERYV